MGDETGGVEARRERSHERETELWRGRQGAVGNATAGLTALEGSVKNTVQVSAKQNEKLQLRQLVNKEKHFTDLKFKGSKRL